MWGLLQYMAAELIRLCHHHLSVPPPVTRSHHHFCIWSQVKNLYSTDTCNSLMLIFTDFTSVLIPLFSSLKLAIAISLSPVSNSKMLLDSPTSSIIPSPSHVCRVLSPQLWSILPFPSAILYICHHPLLTHHWNCFYTLQNCSCHPILKKPGSHPNNYSYYYIQLP